MQRLVSLLVLMAFVITTINAQQHSLLAPLTTPLSDVAALSLPTLDNEALKTAEMARRGPGIAPQFAEAITVDVSPTTDGTWEETAFGELVWRLRIPSPQAKSINLGFDEYYMPAGASLYLYNADYSVVQGPFTPSDNEKHGEFWAPIIPGDELIIEVQIPRSQLNELSLHLKTVNHDFIGFLEVAESLSGSCNLDVVCSEEDGYGIVDGYRDIIRSVAVISTGGNTFCTGYLINNARQDCTPYFMTAAHCGINNGNAASLVAYWNFENSTCRAPGSGASGGNGDGALTDFNSGATWRAAYGGGGVSLGDATLVEFDDPISETANAFFAGWDVTGTMAYDTVIGIHHPATDEKRISFEFEPTIVADYLNDNTDPNATWIRVEDWDIGTTEGGSSGSPLFNTNKQVIGLLSGGYAACGNDDPDWYGWLTASWEGGGSPTTRLRDWLDPDNTGVLTLDGREQMLCSFFVSATPAAQTICAPQTATFAIDVSENFTSDVNLTINNLPAGLMATLDDSQINPGGSTQLIVSQTNAVAAGVYSFEVEGTDGENSSLQLITLTINAGVPAAVNLVSPSDMVTDQSTVVVLSWDAIPLSNSYDVQIATDLGFSAIVSEGAAITNTSYTSSALNVLTTYFWRVKARNICGEGNWSAAYSFSTASVACNVLASEDVPVEIEDVFPGAYTSTLEIDVPGEIISIGVSGLNITHTFVGDLEATLTSPEGTTILLFGEPDNGNCNNDNLILGFDDFATNTYADFQNTCDGGPAISGIYQPAQALAAFANEDATGVWTLIVSDNAFNDGGSIDGWNLDICSVVPNIVNIDASIETQTVCAGNTVDFTISLGSGFVNNDISLSADGLPMGSDILFSNNPATPGSTVNVSISDLTAGSHTVTLIANDGADEANTQIILNVEDVTAAPALTIPSNGLTDVSVLPGFSWNAVAGANAYNIIISTDPDFSTTFFEETVSTNAVNVGPFENSTTYYWTVAAINDCGTSIPSNAFSFTTIPNVDLSSNATTMSACLSESANYVIAVGEGLGDDLTATYSISPMATFTLDNTFNTADRELTITASNLVATSAGAYQITVTITGEGYSNDIDLFLIIDEGPEVPTLIAPINNQDLAAGDNYEFSWTTAANADSYLVEIATDETFNDIIESMTVSGTSASLMAPIPTTNDIFYWRVRASNSCGDAVTASRIFLSLLVDVQEINGAALTISPNPTTGLLQIKLTENLPGNLYIESFAANGQRLQQWQMPAIGGTQNLNISQWADGVYTFRITNGQTQLIERVVLMK